MKKYFFYIPVAMIIVGIPIAILVANKNKYEKDNETNRNTDGSITEESYPEGTIVVEAGEGTLINGGYYSYITESARGLEAYLAEKGASATYEFNSPNAGAFTLWVKLNDDDVHPDGTRSVTAVINNTQTKGYNHISEDTKGWKWYSLGLVNLNGGANYTSFTKNETTSAAYVMDEFRFVPVE